MRRFIQSGSSKKILFKDLVDKIIVVKFAENYFLALFRDLTVSNYIQDKIFRQGFLRRFL